MTKEYRVIVPAADIRESPDINPGRGKLESQLVFGETFFVDNPDINWSHGSCMHDGYKGWINNGSIREVSGEVPTHVVTAVRSPLFAEPNVRTPLPLAETFSFLSRVRPTQEKNGYTEIAPARWLYSGHLAPADSTEPDYVATAMKFLETPYRWGGRSGFGIDCSGLLQVAFARAGIKIPRDTEQQIDAIGKPVETPQRGDIVFFRDHVGIMTDEDTVIHANASLHMKVALEPLKSVARRYKGIKSIRRP